jgi:UDP-N-acetylglucosamine 2-epimerase (non-hydrolysing)
MGKKVMIPFINILIGTRGQFVKMAPVLKELDKSDITYRIIHTGQHTVSTKEMAEVFGVRHGDVFLTRRTSDITSIKNALLWFCICFVKGIGLDPRDRACSSNACMIHGDTLSALIGCLCAFFWGQRLVHVESGLTTGTIWVPFPEEIIRRICMARAQVMYAPSAWAAGNCAKRKVKGDVVCTDANTVLDSVRYALAKTAAETRPQPYGVVTLHRNETFYSRKNAAAAVDALSAVPEAWKLLFVMHRLTERRLRKYGLFDRLLQSRSIEILGYVRYGEFMSLVSRASFVITDGGGLQEETFYLNVPCLVLRRTTERPEGIGSSAAIGAASGAAVQAFVNSLTVRKHSHDFSALAPSATIVGHMRRTFPLEKGSP